jgi:hypothetical protein
MNVDIVVAAAEAYLTALNRMLAARAARESATGHGEVRALPSAEPRLTGWRARA